MSNPDKSIEWTILEDAVEGSPASLWNVVDYVGYDNPDLDRSGRVRGARELVRRMVDSNLIRIIRPRAEDRNWESYPTIWPELEWETGVDTELKNFIIVATPEGEAIYPAY